MTGIKREDDKAHFPGTENLLIRLYFYLNSGLGILNNFRNLFLGIIAVFFALKLTNPLWMAALFIPSVLILTVIGYYNVHRMGKVVDWLSIRFSSHYGIQTFEYQQGIYDTLQRIEQKLADRV